MSVKMKVELTLNDIKILNACLSKNMKEGLEDQCGCLGNLLGRLDAMEFRGTVYKEFKFHETNKGSTEALRIVALSHDLDESFIKIVLEEAEKCQTTI